MLREAAGCSPEWNTSTTVIATVAVTAPRAKIASSDRRLPESFHSSFGRAATPKNSLLIT